MKYEMMFPEDIKRAIDDNIPVVLPVGVLEYHAEHCVIGVDGILVVKALEIVEKETDMVILPPFYYGAASFAVEPPELKGTLDIDSDIAHKFARSLFANLLAVGFRNIHVFIHHQTENFSAGMPTDLAMKLAARQVLFEFLENERGRGWWGDEKMEGYYESHASGDDPFNWIKIHPLMDAAAQEKFPIDHAGRQETSLMLAFCPEGVREDRISKGKWYVRGAKEAELSCGNKAREMIVETIRGVINEGKKS